MRDSGEAHGWRGGPATSYDEVPYESFAVFETHPDHLAVMGRLFGLTPPAVETCRVLELGCAGGGNLIPLAQVLPGGRFVGVDLSGRQIAQAKANAEALGLANITFHAMSLTEVARD